MLFHFSAFDQQNRLVEGDIDMSNIDAVLEYLSRQLLRPIKITPLETGVKKILGFIPETISLKDQVFLFKYLALMLRVGTDLLKALNMLMEDYQPGPTKRFLLEARINLERGNPFYVVFEKHPESFSVVTANLVKAGEKSGTLEEVLTKLSENLESSTDLQSKVKSSLAYPTILIVIAIGMIIFLLIFLFPKMASSFLASGMKLPTYTKILISISNFFNKNKLWILTGGPLLLISLVVYFGTTSSGKRNFNKILKAIPPIRHFMNAMSIQRLTDTLSSLLHSGMPLMEAIKVTADTVGDDEYKNALLHINQNISRGMTVGEAFKQEKIFPTILSNLLSMGEKAGHVSEILATLSNFYKKELENQLKSLVALIEPVILIFMGVVVGGIALSVIMPMYQMIGNMGNVEGTLPEGEISQGL